MPLLLEEGAGEEDDVDEEGGIEGPYTTSSVFSSSDSTLPSATAASGFNEDDAGPKELEAAEVTVFAAVADEDELIPLLIHAVHNIFTI